MLVSCLLHNIYLYYYPIKFLSLVIYKLQTGGIINLQQIFHLQSSRQDLLLITFHIITA